MKKLFIVVPVLTVALSTIIAIIASLFGYVFVSEIMATIAYTVAIIFTAILVIEVMLL